MTKVSIRPFLIQDEKKVLPILMAADVGERQEIKRFFHRSIAHKTDNLYVAKHGLEIIGIIGWYLDDGECAGEALGDLFPGGDDVYWVSYFAVKEGFRHQGVGTLLVKHLTDKLNQLKARELWVYTTRARKFYQKLDFEFVIRSIIED